MHMYMHMYMDMYNVYARTQHTRSMHTVCTQLACAPARSGMEITTSREAGRAGGGKVGR